MDNLLIKSNKKVAKSIDKVRRLIYDDVQWNERLILLLGYRGVGKTTLMLQRLKEFGEKGIYFSLDDLYFETNRLATVVEQLYSSGFRAFFIDEVHRYAFWSKDLKQLYDDYDDIHLVATGSSILEVAKGQADLSRRAVVHQLQGLTFREYLQFEKKINLSPIDLETILERHYEISSDLSEQFSFRRDFNNYLKNGYFPFYRENKSVYFQKLSETINLVIDIDIAPFEELNYSTVRTMKKLLYVISQSVPFVPNITKLSERLEAPRNTILRLLDLLHQAKIIKLLYAENEKLSYLKKPEKIFLENTNFMYLFAEGKANIGSIRETFFFNQLANKHRVNASKWGDFMVDEKYTFEVGGSNKNYKQIKGVPNSYLAIDIENGVGNKVPLWLFGMLK
ncbi:MAG: ATP-binding protein [Flavobacteriales bacterium]|nr:ATP-binding protein [Flavobacteriales bacterium]